MKTEDELRRVVRDLCACHRIDIAAFCDDLCMGWEEIAHLAADPLVTIGAHTVNHVMLKKISTESNARSEMEMSRAVIEAALNVRPQHLAYPVGDPTSAGQREFRIAGELGFKTAVTTRPGVLFKAHRETPHRVAPDLGQWRISAAALSESADIGRGDRDVEWLPPRRCHLVR